MDKQKKNGVAAVLKIAAFATWGLGIILALVEWWGTPVIMTVNTTLVLSIFITAAVAGFMMFAFGEIVSLLHRIAQNTSK